MPKSNSLSLCCYAKKETRKVCVLKHKKESSMAAELSFHREVYNLWVVNNRFDLCFFKGKWFYLADNIHDGAVTTFDNTYNSVTKLNRFRLTCDRICDIAKFLNGL